MMILIVSVTTNKIFIDNLFTMSSSINHLFLGEQRVMRNKLPPGTPEESGYTLQ